MLDKWNKKEKPVFTGITRGVGGFGFGAGLLTEFETKTLRYFDRTAAQTYNNYTYKPGQLSTSNYSVGWSHNGSNADGIVINVSGTGTYELYSLSIGSSGQSASDVFTRTLYLRVETGNTTGSGTVLLNTSASYTLGYSSDRWHELVLPSPVTLDRGQDYFIGYGVATGDGFPNSNQQNDSYHIQGSHATTAAYITTSAGNSAIFDALVTITDASYGAADPFDSSNGTDRTRGQIPIIGIKI